MNTALFVVFLFCLLNERPSQSCFELLGCLRARARASGKGTRTNSWTESVRLGGVGMMNWTPG